MKPHVDPTAFGERVRKRRKELEWSQGRLAKESGYSQTNIGWVETGQAKDPTKQALRLAEAMGTTADWLLYQKGPKEVGPHVMTPEELRRAFYDLPSEAQLEFRAAMTDMFAKWGVQRKKA